MNTQTKLAQVDAEIAELQAKLAKAQERRELLALVKPACDSALEEINKALDILLCVELSTEVEMAEITKFKAAIDARFTPKSLEIELGVTEIKTAPHWHEALSRWTSSEIKQTEIQAEVAFEAAVQVAKIEVKHKPSGYRAKVLADKYFPTRPAQSKQFEVIIQELEAIGIKVGKSFGNRDDAKGWNLCWGSNKAKLFWIVGPGWAIKALHGELTGRFEGFDLDDYLTANDIDLEEYIA